MSTVLSEQGEFGSEYGTRLKKLFTGKPDDCVQVFTKEVLMNLVKIDTQVEDEEYFEQVVHALDKNQDGIFSCYGSYLKNSTHFLNRFSALFL